MKTVTELIKLLEKKYKSSKGFMGVRMDGVESVQDLIENVRDEVFSITENLEHSGEPEDLFGMTVREAKGYVKKLENFLTEYGNTMDGCL